MAKALEHRSVKVDASKVIVTPRAVSRRDFFRLGLAGAALLTVLQGGIIGSIVSMPKTAHAQPSDARKLPVAPYSLKELKEMDAQMDGKYKRHFWETKEGYFVTAKVTGEHSSYIEVSGGTISTTMKKGFSVTVPKDKSNPGGDTVGFEFDLQELHDSYLTVCPPGCEKKDKIWLKVIFGVNEGGVDIMATFVDERPRSGDSSDLKPGYPMMGAFYDNKANKAYKTKPALFRIGDEEKKIAKK